MKYMHYSLIGRTLILMHRYVVLSDFPKEGNSQLFEYTFLKAACLGVTIVFCTSLDNFLSQDPIIIFGAVVS